ncbi:hypothetical protein KAX97_10765 [candidate division WOR-3 bacterium]|nr:hypothetical protein [candidate division WOR-3 bacterium]
MRGKFIFRVKDLLPIWEEVCELKGMNSWAIAEGLMDKEDEITFTLEEAVSLGLINYGKIK